MKPAHVSPIKLSFRFLSVLALSLANLCAHPAQAQSVAPPPSIIPTDITPIGLGRERELIRPGPTFYLLQRLPSRLWINSSTEISQRGETNVFFTNRNHRADYVFRALPNITIGYKFLPRTSIYTNYFVLKDVFANNGVLSNPTTQSLSMGLRHEIPIRTRTNLQFDLQAREIWQARGLNQFDWLPGVTLTHVVNPSTIVFGNIQLQMRGAKYFVSPTREIDPFYTVGILHRRGPWTFSLVDTFVCNFRNNNAIPPQSNLSMIPQLEVARQVSKKVPGLVTFVRAEPVFNWQSRSTPGISGFDFRIFGGLRYSFNKAATNTAMDTLRKQLNQSALPPAQAPASGGAVSPATSQVGDTGKLVAERSASDTALGSQTEDNLANTFVQKTAQTVLQEKETPNVEPSGEDKSNGPSINETIKNTETPISVDAGT